MAIILGNSEDNLINGTSSNDVITGENGADTIEGGAGSDIIDGGNGADTIEGGSGNDILSGGNGEDTLDGGAGNDILSGGNGEDTLEGGAGNDLLSGGNGDDYLEGGAGNDLVNGDSGNDTLAYNVGENLTSVDFYNGGNGTDTLQFTFDFSVLSQLSNSFGYSSVNSYLSSIQNFFTQQKSAGYSIDFSRFGFNLTAQNIENLTINIVDGPNIAPTALPGATAVTVEDASYTFKLSNFGFSDPDVGDTLQSIRFTNLPSSDNGQLLLNSAPVIAGQTILATDIVQGKLQFSPAENVNGTNLTQFNYQVSDGDSWSTNSAATNINVSAVNDAPIAHGISNQVVSEESTFTFTVPNEAFTDVDKATNGDTLTYSATLADGNALPDWLHFDSTSHTLSGTPDDPNVGTINIKITATDSNNAQASNIFNLTVNPVNDAPVARNDTAVVNEDNQVVINPLANDTDVDGDNLVVSNFDSASAQGGVITYQDGNLVYAPAANFNGTDTFNYSIADGKGGTHNATVSVNVLAVNDAPTANADSLIVDQNSNNNIINVLNNDTQGPANESSQLLKVIAANADFGLVTINEDGTLSYKPNDGHFGDDVIHYTIQDNGLTNDVLDPKTASSVVNVTINQAGDLFTEQNDTVNFNAITAGQYPVDQYYNALGGNDTVYLPQDEAHAQLSGYDINVGFRDGAGSDNIYGGNLNDLFIASSAPASDRDFYSGGGGVDTVFFGQVNAAVTVILENVYQNTGGAGTQAYGSIENAIGTNFNDVLVGNSDANQLAGAGGDDTLYGQAGNDYLVGGLGNDTIYGGTGIDTVSYYDAASQVNVILSSQTDGIGHVTGGAGNDTVSGIENIVGSYWHGGTLTGSDDDNTFFVGVGDDFVNGGKGTDTISYELVDAGVVVNLLFSDINNSPYAQNTQGAGVDLILSIENVTGTQFNDAIQGDANNNIIDDGGAGNDLLVGGLGNDTASYSLAQSGVTVSLLLQSQSQNTIGSGLDQLFGFENLSGSNFDDKLIGDNNNNVLTGGNGNDELIGNGGIDTASYSTAASGVSVDLQLQDQYQNTLSAGQDKLSGIENLTGSDYNDTLIGNGSSNTLTGGKGNDTLTGMGGDDYLRGGPGTNILDGGLGIDTVDYRFHNSTLQIGVNVSLTANTAQNNTGVQVPAGEVFHDSLSSIENIIGSAYPDTLIGNDADNVIFPGANSFSPFSGNFDTIDGKGGVDTVDYLYSLESVNVQLSNNTHLLNVENVYGSNFDDSITGDAGNNTLYGRNGNDILNGGAGNDTIYANGNDFIDGGLGTDTVSYKFMDIGVTLNLLFPGVFALNSITDTLSSIENIEGTNFNDGLTGDDFVNTITGGAGNDTLVGAGGADTLDGGIGNDTLRGGADNDYLAAGEGSNQVFGDDGDDFMLDGGINSSDRYTGGAGIDTVSYANALSNVIATLYPVDQIFFQAGNYYRDTGGGGSDWHISIENLIGSNFDDVLNGNDANNVLQGGIGNDTLVGGLGSDTASYADAASSVVVTLQTQAAQNTFGSGTDTLVSIENLIGSDYDDSLTGNSGNNIIDGGKGDDFMDGGLGNDTVSYASASAGVSIDMYQVGTYQNTGGAGNDALTGFENIIGSSFGDVIKGNDGNNMIWGGAGNDFLSGGGGNDIIDGGAGDDEIYGIAGFDTASYGSASGGVTVSLALQGTFQDTGSAGSDNLNGINNLSGSNFNDILTGDDGDNIINGLLGADTLKGGKGNDRLSGGEDPMNVNHDTAVYTGAFNEYEISSQNNGDYSIFDTVAGRDGSDVVSNIRYLSFSDMNVDLSTLIID
ncbi:MAG: tandem-95 repeat protein [Gammaproteobacteria bacterium]|nr:tandem-95 repeat protein [Gammaproteobacteria bacterium]